MQSLFHVNLSRFLLSSLKGVGEISESGQKVQTSSWKIYRKEIYTCKYAMCVESRSSYWQPVHSSVWHLLDVFCSLARVQVLKIWAHILVLFWFLPQCLALIRCSTINVLIRAIVSVTQESNSRFSFQSQILVLSLETRRGLSVGLYWIIIL